MARMAYDPKKPVDLAKLRSVSVAGSAMPTRKGAVNRIQATEDRWDKEFAAYRRLRKDGLQPEGTDGADKLEQRADEAYQVEGGLSPKVQEVVGEAFA